MWLAVPELDWRALAGIAFAVIVTLGHIFGETKKKREDKEREERARERRRESASRPPQSESARPRAGTADGGIAPPGGPRREPLRRPPSEPPARPPRPRVEPSGQPSIPRPPRRQAPITARPTEPANTRVTAEMRRDAHRSARPMEATEGDSDHRTRLKTEPSPPPPTAVRAAAMEGAAQISTISAERSRRRTSAGLRIAEALRRQSNARTAIILSEIISPPVGLREPRE